MDASTGHVRSSRLPSNTHPLVASVEEQLTRLKASQETSSSISHRLGDLKELYHRVDDLIHLPLTQQALCPEQLEDVLDGSLRLLDVCGTRDVLSRMRKSVQCLMPSFVSLPKPRSKPSGWSIVSKVLHSKRASIEEVEASEAEKLDAELIFLTSGKDIKLVRVQKVSKGLEAFQSTIKETEEELECIFRRLLKTIVSLLNILNY